MLKKTLVVKFRSKIDVVPIKEIVYLEKDLRRILVHTEDKVYVLCGRFDDIMPYLDVRFRRAHRSYILNYDRIAHMEDMLIRMDDSSELTFGKPLILRLKKDFESYVAWQLKKLKEIDERAGLYM